MTGAYLPDPPRMNRAYSDIRETEAGIVDALRVVRSALGTVDDESELDYAICALECFVDVALRLMSKSNPSKVRDCARIVEIKARMDGKQVVRGTK